MKEYKSSIAKRFEDDYFEDRVGNDPKRLKQFDLDGNFIRNFVKHGRVCDVGCSSGEFLQHINFEGELYGMEVSDTAKELAKDIIYFDKNIFTEENFFDLIIFRGTIQHVDEPFRMIKQSLQALKPGGHLVFIATPNSNSPYYKINKTLPFLDAPLNFYIPADHELKNALENFGFEHICIEYPYIETPYKKIIPDHLKFLINYFFRIKSNYPFWKSMMNISCKKPL